MFRDDHEAAVARIAALEAELERERAEDVAQSQRVAELEYRLDDARAKLRAAEAELAEHRPRRVVRRAPAKEPPELGTTAVAHELPETPKRPGLGAGAIFVAVLLVSVVAVGVILMVLGVGTPSPSPP